ncbi:MAG TPA: hypothetical protein VGV36_09830 [Solirubrobacteraceae bacterium]|nr:hypothetical protein [Solirubrobacteraceae bacterium]
MASLRNLFWILALGVIVSYVFFWALGAFALGDVVWLTLVVVALAGLWIAHAVLERRHAGGRDIAMVRARERRGF